VALLALTWLVAFHVGFAERADQSIFRGFAGLQRPRVNTIANFIANLCDPKPFVCFAALIVVVALVRGRPRVGLAAAVILVGSSVSTQLLKPLLAAPRPHWLLSGIPQISSSSWPSGHATAAMSLALCAVLVAPARWRPVVAALGAAFAIAVSYSFLTLGWHYPSDVLGGFLVAAIWSSLVVAGMFALDARRRRETGVAAAQRLSLRQTLGPPAAALAGLGALAGLVALARPHEVVAYARGHEAFMVGAASIAVLGLALATGVTLTLRRYR
jgi:membrane-associated phospholipid phosphatase